MGSSKKKLVMSVVSTILIPLGTFFLQKIAKKVIDKLESKSSYYENDNPFSTARYKKSQ